MPVIYVTYSTPKSSLGFVFWPLNYLALPPMGNSLTKRISLGSRRINRCPYISCAVVLDV